MEKAELSSLYGEMKTHDVSGLYPTIVKGMNDTHKGGFTYVDTDNINKPSHYTKGIETYDYINSWGMSFTQGNIIKYVTRYQHKNGLEDLKKAKWYLDKLIEEVENGKN